ncbi:MAG: hypothetical protein ABR549_08960 [Mycobacteriales bacterium]
MLKTTLCSGLLAGALLMTGCSSGSSGHDAAGRVPSPLATLPYSIGSLSQTIGEYVVTPRKELSPADLSATVEAVQKQAGVQSAKLTAGKLRVEILPAATETQRIAILEQLGAVGHVAEGF